MRPFYFMLSVWGDRFSGYLANLCVPSLLAPGNVPVLGPGSHKFLIACPREDWDRLVELPSIKEIARFLELVHLDIPLPSPGVSATVHMGVGHKKMTERCFDDKAFGVALTPDLILSDGTVANLKEAVRRGESVVLCAALRFAEEPFFDGLLRAGHVDAMLSSGGGQRILALSGREMVRLGMPAFHSQTRSYQIDSPAFAEGSPAAIWRMPGGRGVLIHSLTWAPLLMDYAVVKRHDTTALDEWTMDGDYVAANFGDEREIHVVDDSDEMMLISWAPSDDRPIDLRGDCLRRWFPSFCRWFNGIRLRYGVRTGRFDSLKRKVFLLPVRWHVDDLDEDWRDIEGRACRVVAAPTTWSDAIYPGLAHISHRLRWNLERARVIYCAVLGDGKARDLIRSRFRKIFRQSAVRD